jgi:TonB family protein
MNMWSIRRYARGLFFCILVALAFLSGRAAHAQQPEVNDLAAKIARSLQASGQKKVVVVDFIGPDRKLTSLGSKLADDFSRALSQADGKLHVQDRRKMLERMRKEGYTLQVFANSGTALELGREFKADAVIQGKISREDNHLKISVRATKSKDKGHEVIETDDVTIPVTPDLANLTQTYLETADLDLPESGDNGFSYPACMNCPPAQPSQASLDAKFPGGTVMLIVVITPDGRARDIQIAKELPYGLTSCAVEAVKHWTFKPATGRDGKPMAVRQIIEVTFHLP